MQKPRLLTGDTPTGKLHLGHWVGSLENRVALQSEYDCYFIIANTHAFTTRHNQPDAIHQSVLDIALDYLAAGIDPDQSTIFVQSDVRAIYELTFFFSMLLTQAQLMRNPTIKEEIRDKGLGDSYPFGFLLYPIGQVADILSFRPEVVPVGEDQIPHLELARDIARRFNQLYCGVDPHTPDEQYLEKGGLFPIIKPLLGREKRLVGTGAPVDGKLLKMSKSLNNAIYLSDDNDTIRKKVMGMYTDPKRLKATDPGTVENNPLWIFHEAFNPDTQWVQASKAQYQAGTIGDVTCKKALVDVLVTLISPMRERRKHYEDDVTALTQRLKMGAEKANACAEVTLQRAKVALKQCYG